MRLFVEAGIPLEEVWKLATSGNGAALKPGLGRLDPGAPADFLIFRKDPTQDLANLSTLEAVVADGRLYTRADRTTPWAPQRSLSNGRRRHRDRTAHGDGAVQEGQRRPLKRKRRRMSPP
jgi:cytosine/adenosine deaminase-related metal-dependent hydrolase